MTLASFEAKAKACELLGKAFVCLLNIAGCVKELAHTHRLPKTDKGKHHTSEHRYFVIEYINSLIKTSGTNTQPVFLLDPQMFL